MARRRKVGNLLALGLLALLMPGQSMHPYEMANVLKRTGKERDFKIKWGTFYTVVQNLEKAGYIVATGSDRAGGRPERTSYAITDAGRAELIDWLREIIADPEPEQSRFEAALSVAGVLGPDQTVELLKLRVAALDQDIEAMAAGLAEAGPVVPRIFLIEAEYALAMRRAELGWVRGILGEIESGTLPGIAEWRRYFQTGEMPPEFQALLNETAAGQATDSHKTMRADATGSQAAGSDKTTRPDPTDGHATKGPNATANQATAGQASAGGQKARNGNGS